MKKPTDMEIEQAVRAREVHLGLCRAGLWQAKWGTLETYVQIGWINVIREANRVRDKYERRAKK